MVDVPTLGGVGHVARVNQQAKDLGLVNAENRQANCISTVLWPKDSLVPNVDFELRLDSESS